MEFLHIIMLKNTAESITPSLTTLFNMSIQHCCFPSAWKLANVVPIPKTLAIKSSPASCRPISLLLIVSKVPEKHIYFYLLNHVNESVQYLVNNGVFNLENLSLLH